MLHKLNKFPEDKFICNLLNAIPGFVFVVDEDVRLLYWNSSAQVLFKSSKNSIYLRRGGEAFCCIHSYEAPSGCGRAKFCKKCPLRISVTKALNNNRACRDFARFERYDDDKLSLIYFLVTASPFKYHEMVYVLLVLEDVSSIINMTNGQHLQYSVNRDFLSKREKEVLRWLKEGKSSMEISKVIGISERTINFHIYNIIRKLGAINRIHAVALAVESGII